MGRILKNEQNAIQAEQRDLDRLRERIQGRWRYHREHGLSTTAGAHDRLDVLNYNRRQRALHERITDYEARLTAFPAGHL